MPARPLIQAPSLLRGRASQMHLGRLAIAPVSVPLPLGRASPHFRGYRISSRLLASSSDSGASHASTSGWSSGSVLAVAAAAAISGWGLSSFVPLLNKGQGNQDDAKDGGDKEERREEHAALADKDDGQVGFANRAEMQEAS